MWHITHQSSKIHGSRGLPTFKRGSPLPGRMNATSSMLTALTRFIDGIYIFWSNDELTARLVNFEKVSEEMVRAGQLLAEKKGELAHLKESYSSHRYFTEILMHLKINFIIYYVRAFLDLCCQIGILFSF